ncbi:MAG: nucleotide exchange factor GrpE [Candidatus Micrarchaeota archaeon]|nr:nucleotide exchange factor GrpE [Candidatus Micrarchaeota archaeon]MDE1823947.1 nucleotide exchange factor GrpE [Candidatus Micrarchaeota archaeon]MDE1849159.1 nucleotide exchange factor GrpE [Candidatus Micrarchaeota archaeon]
MEEGKEEDNSKNEDVKKNGKEKEEQEDAAAVKDRLLRLAAEFDNYKKRVAKESESARSIGKAEAITKLLPTLDEFELAIESMKNDEGSRGVALIFSNFMSSLKSLGLKEIDADGNFDPYKHEIMLAKESEKPEGTIIEVIRKGYMLNDIMLRPASVMISKGAAKKGEKEEKQ